MVAWLTRSRSTFEIEPSKPYFILQGVFLTRNILIPPRKYLWPELLKSPEALTFFVLFQAEFYCEAFDVSSSAIDLDFEQIFPCWFAIQETIMPSFKESFGN